MKYIQICLLLGFIVLLWNPEFVFGQNVTSQSMENSPLNMIENIPRHALPDIYRESEFIGLAEIQHTEVIDPWQNGLPTTVYTFNILETWKGSQLLEITLRNLGGKFHDGTGMETPESYYLRIDGLYIICLRPEYENLVFPFLKVFQIHGNQVAGKNGHVIEAINSMGILRYSADKRYTSLRYVDPPSLRDENRMMDSPRTLTENANTVSVNLFSTWKPGTYDLVKLHLTGRIAQ